MAEIQNIALRFGLDLSGLKKDLDKLNGALEGQAGKLKNIGGSLSKNLSLPLGIASAASVKLATDMNRGMSLISTLIPGNADRIRDLRTELQDLSLDAGRGFGEVVQGAYDTLSAFGDSEDATDKLAVAIDNAKAGAGEASQALGVLSGVTKAYSDTSLEAIKRTGDMTQMTITLGQTTLPRLSRGMQLVTSSAAGANVSQEELFATMATGTGVLGTASQVATRLKAAISSVKKPQADLAKVMEDAGYKTGAAWIQGEGLQGVMKQIADASDKTGKSVEQYVGSTEAADVVQLLARGSADKYVQALDAMHNSAGTLDAAIQAQATGVGSFADSLDKLKSIGMTVAQVIGGVFADSFQILLGPAVEKLIGFVKGLRDRFEDMHPATKGLITVVTGLAIAAGPVIAGLGALLSLLPLLSAGVGILAGAGIGLNAAFLPITGTIAAVVAGGYLLWRNWDKITAFVKKNFRPQIEALKKTFNEAKKTIRLVAAAVFTVLKQKWGQIAPLVKGYFDGIVHQAKALWAVVSGLFKINLDIVLGGIRFFLALFRGDWSGALDVIRQTASNVWDSLRDIFLKGVDAILGTLEAWLGWIPGWGDKIGAARQAIADRMESIAATSAAAEKKIVEESQAEEVSLVEAHQETLTATEASGAFVNGILDRIRKDQGL